MQQLLGVSIVKPANSLAFVPETSPTFNPENTPKEQGVEQSKAGFTQILNSHVSSKKEIEQSENDLQDSDLNEQVNGQSLPIKLEEIGNKLADIESLGELKEQLEKSGLSPMFFNIDLESNQEIEIQPTQELELENTLMKDYSSILIMQVSVESDVKHSEIFQSEIEKLSAKILNSESLNIDQSENESSMKDEESLLIEQISENASSEIMQWVRVNDEENKVQNINSKQHDFMSQILGSKFNESSKDQTQLGDKQLKFDPALKNVTPENIKQLLKGAKEIESDFMALTQSSENKVSLIVFNLEQNAENIDEESNIVDLMPSHVNEQLFLQTNVLEENPAIKLNNPALEDISIEDSEFTSEFLKTKNTVKEEGKLANTNTGIVNENLENEEVSEYEEIDLTSDDLEFDEPVKTKRALQSEVLNQNEKSLSGKPVQVELPAINLSDAKATNAAIKAIPTQAQELMQTILPEKQAVKLTEEVGARVMMLHNQKMTTAFIRIDPPELGALEIQIETKGDEAKVTIVTQSVNVKEALDSQANRLREMLLEQGFVSVDVDVSEQDQSNLAQGDSESNEADSNEAQENEEQSETLTQSSAHLVDKFV